ncbi:L-seryl-tRNA(Sec) selenium transferase [uncultured Sulfitobacter sp.]|uniref:L-seryl-tRNA(Sec) selenium transferase n=1 Tax=uncultured Sulfitobacter sp. TaxID=191468 RepID=UPI00261AD018|nr:L-seryl-tRNA(Sec) selenium transferase [uncultured Sulfitobacter sp.]
MATHLRDLPQINSLLAYPGIAALAQTYSQSETVDALRIIVDGLRTSLLAGGAPPMPDFASTSFAARVDAQIVVARQPALRGVINATGVIIHTNLGRARLAPQAIAAMQSTAATFSNLELDLATGKRGSRHSHTERLICDLTGAQAAVVVNNCAAAVLLALVATAQGRTVIASRGELIEIGGSYRLPDVIAQSGATLHEVGTTNKTRASDYADAIDDNTAVLLKSHTSNFKIIGFTAAPTRAELALIAAERRLVLMEDLGSGVLIDLAPYGLTDEPVVADILKSGVDLVMFSGDKLLGGPQAGIIAGRRDLIAALKSHPLMRAVRIDKLSLAALEATLRLYRAPHDPMVAVPVLRMLSEPAEQVAARARMVVDQIAPVGRLDAKVVETVARVGAGALPEQDLVSHAVSLASDDMSADALMAALRASDPPIIGRIEHDRVLLDVRTIDPSEGAAIVRALNSISGK